jgi:hypothetical protein
MAAKNPGPWDERHVPATASSQPNRFGLAILRRHSSTISERIDHRLEATAMEEDREQRIRNAAYGIWVEEGFPENQEERHWRMAELIVAQEDVERPVQAPVPNPDNTEKFLAQRI